MTALPSGGSYLVAMRMSGQRPPGTIWVTESRELARRAKDRLDAHSLIVDFDRAEAYDMRCVHGLDVCLFAHDRKNTVALSQAILAAEPRSFRVWIDREETEWVIPWPCKPS